MTRAHELGQGERAVVPGVAAAQHVEIDAVQQPEHVHRSISHAIASGAQVARHDHAGDRAAELGQQDEARLAGGDLLVARDEARDVVDGDALQALGQPRRREQPLPALRRRGVEALQPLRQPQRGAQPQADGLAVRVALEAAGDLDGVADACAPG